MITQERLKELLEYNPDTGVFIWKVQASNRAIIGSAAGFIHAKGYRHIGLDGREYKAHRLAWLYMYGEFPENQIDHINHKRDDNRLVNFRSVKNCVNGKNQSIPSDNTSGIIGVYWHKQGKKWKASIMVDGKHIHLGMFKEKALAALSRKAAEIKYGFHPNHGH